MDRSTYHASNHNNVNGYDCDVNTVETVRLSFRLGVPEHLVYLCVASILLYLGSKLHIYSQSIFVGNQIHAMIIKYKYNDNFPQSNFDHISNIQAILTKKKCAISILLLNLK